MAVHEQLDPVQAGVVRASGELRQRQCFAEGDGLLRREFHRLQLEHLRARLAVRLDIVHA